MDIQGYQVLSEPTGDGHVYDPPLKPGEAPTTDHVMAHDGFDSIVKKTVDGKEFIRGPFPLVREAIEAAKAWKKEDEAAAKSKLQAVEDAAPIPIKTVNDNPAVQVPPAVVIPPTASDGIAIDSVPLTIDAAELKIDNPVSPDAVKSDVVEMKEEAK